MIAAAAAATSAALTATAGQAPIASPSGCAATKSASANASSAMVPRDPAIGRAARPHHAPPATNTRPPIARTPVSSATPNPARNVAAATSGMAARRLTSETVDGGERGALGSRLLHSTHQLFNRKVEWIGSVTSDQLSNTFSALADPTRRAILDQLAAGDATVNELAEPFPISVQAVSKHLKVLERAGLITRGRSAQLRPSHLRAEPLKDASEWLGDYRRFWTDSFDQLDKRLRGR
jgi:DNA-binding transcriptional ArsR family regulator